MNVIKKRYNWLDVFKSLSIFFVIYYHLDSNSFTVYINAFLVQLFFYAAGVTARLNSDLSVARYALKRFRQIMIPYFSFGIISMIVRYFDEHRSIAEMAKQLLKGKRNDIFVVTLWFLPCLFVMGVFYHCLIKAVPSTVCRVVLSVMISFVFRLFSEGNMLLWGVDNAIRFLVYYALGDGFSDFLNSINIRQINSPKTQFMVVLGLSSGLLTALHYRRGFTWLIDLFGISHSYLALFLSLFMCSCIALVFYTFVSMLLQNITPLQQIGKASLGVCCLQLISDKLLTAIMQAVNVDVVYSNRFGILIVTVALIVLSVLLHNILKKYLPFLYGNKYKYNNSN